MWYDELPTADELHRMISFLSDEERSYILGFLTARVDPYEIWSAFNSSIDFSWKSAY